MAHPSVVLALQSASAPCSARDLFFSLSAVPHSPVLLLVAMAPQRLSQMTAGVEGEVEGASSGHSGWPPGGKPGGQR